MNVKRPPRNINPLPLGSQAAPIRRLDRHTSWSVPISPTVTIVNDPPYRSLYVSGGFQSRFHLARPADECYALVMLVEGKFITQCRLADAYGYDHDTINNWVRRYRDFGAAGLLRINPRRLDPPPADSAVTTGSAGPEQITLELALPEGDPVPAPAAAASPGADLPSPPAPADHPGKPARETVIPPAGRAVLKTGTAHPTRYAGKTHVPVRHYHEQVYALVLREPKTERQMTLITNADRAAPGCYSDPDLAAPLLRRWALENYFKVAKNQHGLDQILGHRLVEPGDEDWPVPNPQYVHLKRRLATVERLLVKAQRDAEQLEVRFQALQKKPCWPRFLKQKRNRKIQQRYQALQAEQSRFHRTGPNTGQGTLSPAPHKVHSGAGVGPGGCCDHPAGRGLPPPGPVD